MRRTKKVRHKPEEKGLYLEDINDPELTALYIASPRRLVLAVNSS